MHKGDRIVEKIHKLEVQDVRSYVCFGKEHAANFDAQLQAKDCDLEATFAPNHDLNVWNSAKLYCSVQDMAKIEADSVG